MWFGGNYSGAVFGGPDRAVNRYIDDMYLSTTLDRSNAIAPKAPSAIQVR
jgi:hypothetical protein